MVRIIAGDARGTPLKVPRSGAVRPTADRVREAIFNVLIHRFSVDLSDTRVMDLFGGAGTLGLEALSRGASHVCFVEADPRVAACLRENAQRVSDVRQGRWQIVVDRVERHLERRGRVARSSTSFGLIFLDPPYASHRAPATLSALVGHDWLDPDGLVCVEHSAKEAIEPPPGLELAATGRYGDTSTSFLVLGDPS